MNMCTDCSLSLTSSYLHETQLLGEGRSDWLGPAFCLLDVNTASLVKVSVFLVSIILYPTEFAAPELLTR